ncbi:MAG: 50S ribosomal protein L11 methyltransferase, partial [Betaproteobacteria bacterium]
MFELLLLAPEDCVEPVSDALIDELGALSVSVEDADAGSSAEHALFGEPGMPAPRPGWQRSVIKALFDTEANATDAATLLLAQDWA